MRKARRQVPVGEGADERAARRYTPDRRPVDRVVHRSPQARVAKQSPRGIERERSQKETGLDEEATVTAVDPVLLVEAREEVRGRGAGVSPVGLPGFDLADHVLERGGGEVGHEALDVVRTRAAIVRIPLQHDLPARDVLCDVVGTGGGQRSLDPFRVGRRVRRDRTEGRHGHPRREVRRFVFQPDDEAVALRDDSLGAPPTAVPHRLRPHDVFRVGGGVRLVQPRRERSVDRRGERFRRHRGPGPVAEAKTAAEREREGLRVVRDARVIRRNLRNEAKSLRRGLVRVAHQACARQIEQSHFT